MSVDIRNYILMYITTLLVHFESFTVQNVFASRFILMTCAYKSALSVTLSAIANRHETFADKTAALSHLCLPALF